MQLLACLSLTISFVCAFPTAENVAKLGLSGHDLDNVVTRLQHNKRLVSNGRPIEVSGKHEFQPPNFDRGDQRGPCPGLNALANHGYLPRDGIAGFGDIIVAVNQVYGMGVDLGTVLSLMGTVFTGSPLSLTPSFSIGGQSSKVANIADNLLGLGLLGTPRGLEGSHNIIEADSSFTRNDLYLTGDATSLNMTLFRHTYDAIDENGFSFEDVADRAAVRFDESKATNPDFYYGPLTGMVVRNAAYLFASRLLSNHTAEHPTGRMSKDVFKSFWAVQDDPDTPGGLIWKRGCERIPENWYRIPLDYGLISLNVDLLYLFARHPKLMSIGGNTGTVDTFTGVDFADLLGGVVNVPTLLEGNNLVCFVLEIVKTIAPNMLSSLFKTIGGPLDFLSAVLSAPLLDLACPAFVDLTAGGTDILKTLQEKLPGAAGSLL